jgi:hypothetical protein
LNVRVGEHCAHDERDARTEHERFCGRVQVAGGASVQCAKRVSIAGLLFASVDGGGASLGAGHLHVRVFVVAAVESARLFSVGPVADSMSGDRHEQA